MPLPTNSLRTDRGVVGFVFSYPFCLSGVDAQIPFRYSTRSLLFASNRDNTAPWQHRIGYMICSKEASESRANYIITDCADKKLDDEIDSHARHELLVAVLVA